MGVTDIFLHIPKCGGSSLRTLFARNYEESAILTFAGYRPELDWFRTTPPDFKAKFRLIQGHFPYGVHEGIDRFRYVTLFRDPVERHFSEIKYGLRSPHHPLHDAFTDGRIPIESWAVYAAVDPYFENTTTRYLTGGTAMLDVETRARTLGPVTRADLACAQERLAGFAAFGFADDFSRSALLIGRALGWRNVAYAVRNVSREVAIPAKALAAAQPHFEIDRELLRFARALYEERVHRAGALLDEAAAELDEAVEGQRRVAPDLQYREYVLGVDLPPSVAAPPSVPGMGAVARFLAGNA